jgi:hypothetical protein
MLSRTSSRIALASVSALIAGGALAVPASAQVSPVQDPIPIRPGQYFSGYINGHPPGQAIIWTNCFGPIQPGQTGHPLANQTVEVEPPAISSSTADLGYTGTAADSIVATLGTPTGPIPTVIAKFTLYYVVQDIPTTITVPCSGPGVATFTPVPGSATASPATLSVTFEAQP